MCSRLGGGQLQDYYMDKGSASFNAVTFVVLFDHSVSQGELSAGFSKNAQTMCGMCYMVRQCLKAVGRSHS